MAPTKYINNITKVHNQGNKGICSLVANASSFRSVQAALKEDVSEHQQICRKIEQHEKSQGRDPNKGADTLQVMRQLYKEINFFVDKVDVKTAQLALKKNQSPIISFRLTDQQWKQFQSTFKDNPKAVYDLPPPRSGQKTDGHACVIVGQNQEYFKVKNSWGSQWGDKGFFRISKSSIQNSSDCKIYYPIIAGGKFDDYKKQYVEIRNDQVKFKGGIKQGLLGPQGNNTYMWAKEKQNNHLIQQQKDIQNLKHKNINQVKDVFYDRLKEKHVIVSNFYEKNLQDRLNDKQYISGIKSAYIAADSLQGLEALQKIGRNHGDINSSNIVYDKNSNISKLNDFDISKKFTNISKTSFKNAKVQDSKNLIKVLQEVKSNNQRQKTNSEEDKTYFAQTQQKIQNNLENHKKSRELIQQQVILKEYNKSKNSELIKCAATTFFNTINSIAHDVVYQNGFTKNTVTKGATQLAKGGVGMAVKYLSKAYQESKILEKFQNYSFRLGVKHQTGFMALTQVGKQCINLVTQKEPISQKAVLKSAGNVGLNTAQFFVTRNATQLIEQKAFSKTFEKIANYSANTVSSTVGKSTSVFTQTLKSSAKVGAIGAAVGCVVGIGADLIRGKSLLSAIVDNVKSSGCSFFGSLIGGAIGSAIPVVGTAAGSFVGGLIGGLFSSWF